MKALLVYLGECWTGQKFDDKYYHGQGKSKRCINKCYQRCKRWDRFCIGEGFANTVYRISKYIFLYRGETTGVCMWGVGHPHSLSRRVYAYNFVWQILKIFGLKSNSCRKNVDKFTKILLKIFTNYGKLFRNLVKNAMSSEM